MGKASRIVRITVTIQRGSTADACRVLADVINDLRTADHCYLSVGKVTTTVGRPK